MSAREHDTDGSDAKTKAKIIVVGSKGHDAKCLDWRQPFPNLADYDIVIVNLQSLDAEALEHISKDGGKKFSTMREELYELLESNGKIYCILAPEKSVEMGTSPTIVSFPAPYITSVTYLMNSYDWSPIIFQLVKKQGGTTTIKKDSQELIGYLNSIKRWNFYVDDKFSIRNYYNIFGTRLGPSGEFRFSAESIIGNRSGKMVCASVRLCLEDKFWEWYEGKYPNLIYEPSAPQPPEDWIPEELNCGSMYLLHPPTSISVEEGIDLLIRGIRGETPKTETPTWVNSYIVPGENELDVKIHEVESSIAKLEVKKEELSRKKEELESFKDLLFETGTNLGVAIKKVFDRFKEESPDVITYVSEYEENIEEDLLIKTKYGEAIIESKGVDKKSISLSDVRQLNQYVTDSKIDEGITRKGILIGNPYRFYKPADRDIAFPSNVEEFAEKRGLCLVTSCDLFEVFRRFLKNEVSVDDIVKRLSEASGICNL